MPREVCFCLRGDEPHGHLRAHDDVMFSYFPVLQEFCVTFHLISCFGLIVSRGFLAYLLVLHLTPCSLSLKVCDRQHVDVLINRLILLRLEEERVEFVVGGVEQLQELCPPA